MKRGKGPPDNPVESIEAELFYATCVVRAAHDMRWNLVTCIPNGARVAWKTANSLKRAGVRSGVPDYLIPTPCGPYHGMFLELKRRKGGVVSPEQKAWIAELAFQGYYCVVAKGHMDALDYVSGYFDLGPFSA